MKPFGLSILGIVWRFYLMMAVVIIAGFIGQWWLALLALPIFLSGLLAVKFTNKKAKKTEKKANYKTGKSNLQPNIGVYFLIL